MNYKKLSFFFLFLSFSCHVYSMQIARLDASDIKPYLAYPEKYADFRLTRAYGEPLRSHFDCLPHEIIKCGIQPYLSRLVVHKFQERLLQYRNNSNDNDNDNGASIRYSLKEFLLHDGRYVMVPDIADYSMWDGRNEMFLIEEMTKETKQSYLRLLSCRGPHLDVRFYLELGNDIHNNKKSFRLARRVGESFTMTEFFMEESTSYVFSGDSKWLILSSPGIDPDITFINVHESEDMQIELNTFSLDNPLLTLTVAHDSSLFAVAQSNKIWFIMPEKYQKSIKTDFDIKSVEFSLNDKYLVVYGEQDLLLCQMKITDIPITSFLMRRVNFNSHIEKVFISPDSEIIAIAFKDGEFLFWQNFFNTLPINPHNARWKVDDSGNERSPLVVWNNNSSLMFSLGSRKDRSILKIFKANNGKLLTCYSAYGHESRFISMGITKDDNTMVVMDKKDHPTQIKLYDEDERAVIDFIAKSADWYQLCYLLRPIKNITTNLLLQNIQALIKGMK